MRQVLPLIPILVLATTASLNAVAPKNHSRCTCVRSRTIPEMVEQSGYIFTGVLLDKQERPAPFKLLAYTFLTNRSWKGEPFDTVLVLGYGPCNARFVPGKEYLVLAASQITHAIIRPCEWEIDVHSSQARPLLELLGVPRWRAPEPETRFQRLQQSFNAAVDSVSLYGFVQTTSDLPLAGVYVEFVGMKRVFETNHRGAFFVPWLRTGIHLVRLTEPAGRVHHIFLLARRCGFAGRGVRCNAVYRTFYLRQ